MVTTVAGGGAGTNAAWIDDTGTMAAFGGCRGVAVDVYGNILVADSDNNRVRRVTPSGGTRTQPAISWLCVCFEPFFAAGYYASYLLYCD